MASYLDIKFAGAHTLLTQVEVHEAGNSDITYRFTAVRNAFGTWTCDKVEWFMDGELISTTYWTKMRSEALINSIRNNEQYIVDHSAGPVGRDLLAS